MAFCENTLVARQDLAAKELEEIKTKYTDIINSFSGNVIKIEECGLLNLEKKIKNYKKAFYIHFKFEGNKDTVSEIQKKIKGQSIVLHCSAYFILVHSTCSDSFRFGSASCRSSAFRLALTAWNTNYTRRFNPSCNEEKMFGSKLKSGWRN